MDFSNFFGIFLLFILLAFLMAQVISGIFKIFRRYDDK